MRTYTDYTGCRFGRLTVVERIKPEARNITWLCKCDCGNYKAVTSGNLKNGNVRSCGCLAREVSRDMLLKHGDTNTRLWRIWDGMRRRCYEVTNKDYANYGGRGITFAGEWADYINFRDWAMANGYSDDLTLDRIDVDGNYEPANCRWATVKEQNNNRRSNRLIYYNGEVHTLSQWGDITGISSKTIAYRIKAGWDYEDVFNAPVDRTNRLAKRS